MGERTGEKFASVYFKIVFFLKGGLVWTRVGSGNFNGGGKEYSSPLDIGDGDPGPGSWGREVAPGPTAAPSDAGGAFSNEAPWAGGGIDPRELTAAGNGGITPDGRGIPGGTETPVGLETSKNG